MTIAGKLSSEFVRLWGGRPRLYRAPGRVNLIGEHTDYNDGFVMPAAIGFSTFVALAPRSDRKLRLHSLKMGDGGMFDLDDRTAGPPGAWTNYVRGVAWALEEAGFGLTGADVMVDSDVPIGAGLSSSAALEVAVGFGLSAESALAIDRADLARICQRAENEFVGMRCGIMDQFISCNGEAGHALLLDCRDLTFNLVPIDPRVRLVICNSQVHHVLAGGNEYNLRREECERGVALLSGVLGPIRALRDVTIGQLEQHAGLLPELTYRRCRHVVSENDRVLWAGKALEAGDLAQFGALMTESHHSMRYDYEISCPEIDLLVDLALSIPGVFGSRMTGGGFGGCTISLVEAGAVDTFANTIGQAYHAATGRRAVTFFCSPGPGVEALSEQYQIL